MAHWFHRNPLKATTNVRIESKVHPSNAAAQRLSTEWAANREELLKRIVNPAESAETIQSHFSKYLEISHGFLFDPSAPGSESKMRYSNEFVWTNSLFPQDKAITHLDFAYDVVNICFDVALWYMKHAAMIAATTKDTTEDNEAAKSMHKSLKMSGGIFKYIQDQGRSLVIGQLAGTEDQIVQPGYDLDNSILTAYIHQCMAEAQEVTISRALEMKHSNKLIAGLAWNTSISFRTSFDALSSIDDSTKNKWQLYFKLKSEFYKSYASCFQGMQLLEDNQAGAAVKALQEAVRIYDGVSKICGEYAKTKGPGTAAVPERHAFYKRYGEMLEHHAKKCVRENDIIFHQKIPLENPKVEDLEATHGLVQFEQFSMANMPDTRWTADTYKAFDLSKNLNGNKKNEGKKKKIDEMKELPIPQGEAEPKNVHGSKLDVALTFSANMYSKNFQTIDVKYTNKEYTKYCKSLNIPYLNLVEICNGDITFNFLYKKTQLYHDSSYITHPSTSTFGCEQGSEYAFIQKDYLIYIQCSPRKRFCISFASKNYIKFEKKTANSSGIIPNSWIFNCFNKKGKRRFQSNKYDKNLPKVSVGKFIPPHYRLVSKTLTFSAKTPKISLKNKLIMQNKDTTDEQKAKICADHVKFNDLVDKEGIAWDVQKTKFSGGIADDFYLKCDAQLDIDVLVHDKNYEKAVAPSDTFTGFDSAIELSNLKQVMKKKNKKAVPFLMKIGIISGGVVLFIILFLIACGRRLCSKSRKRKKSITTNKPKNVQQITSNESAMSNASGID
ncbi:hypothetical protein SNEBB_002086 [Seison nebaliae]|nr:hypothetical protein SNEBB_002086 [Seison nebaliae]